MNGNKSFKDLINNFKEKEIAKYIISVVITVLALIVICVCLIAITKSKNKDTKLETKISLEDNANEKDTTKKNDSNVESTETQESTSSLEETIKPNATKSVDNNSENKNDSEDSGSISESNPVSTPNNENTSVSTPTWTPEPTPEPIQETTPSLDKQMAAEGYHKEGDAYVKDITFNGYSAKKIKGYDLVWYTLDLGNGHYFGYNTHLAFMVSDYVDYTEGMIVHYANIDVPKIDGSFIKTIEFINLPIPWGCSEDEYAKIVKNSCLPQLPEGFEDKLKVYCKAYYAISKALPSEDGYEFFNQWITDDMLQFK